MTSSVNEGVGVRVGTGGEFGMAGGAGAAVAALVPGEAGAATATAAAKAEVQSLSQSLPQSLPQSPAPPAISPLTEPTDPGNREPSINPISLDGDGSQVPATLAPGTAQLYLDTYSQLKAEPQVSDGTIPQHLHYPTDMMDLDYSSTQDAMNGIYPQQDQSNMLARLVQLAATHNLHNIGVPPSTVHPSQVSMFPENSVNVLQQATENGEMSDTYEQPPLESFARIEFADSNFQMTTYAVIIGRDTKAAKQSKRDELREAKYREKVERARLNNEPIPSPPKLIPSYPQSYVSNEGGMLGPQLDSDQDDDNRTPQPKRRMANDGSAYEVPQPKRRKANNEPPYEVPQQQTADLEPPLAEVVFNRQYVSHTPGSAPVNPAAFRGSPHYVPFIGIHSPGPNIAEKTKAISRKHLRIQYNRESGVFEAIPLHSNGFFCDDEFTKTESVVLKSGSRLQIKDVSFRFHIYGVPIGCTGAESYQFDDEPAPTGRRYSEGGKEMSFDFESSHDVRRSTSPEEDDAVAQGADESQSDVSDVEMEDVEQEDENEDGVMETIENDGDDHTQQQQPASQDQMPAQPGTELGDTAAGLPQQPPKKRGPGRPPKNGIMSKREERAQKKAAIELAKKNAPPPPPGEPPVKRKVGRPRKHPLPEDGSERPEKRRYKPRKSKNGEEGEGSEGDKAVKEKRREKPKTPPLELRREDYTDEQLLKPTSKNYGVLIDEVLSAAPEGLTLKQIYKRIQQKYPYFYFNVDTKGWESSVRHNLIGNMAFEKNDQTHLWSRVPGIDIDAGKKRKVASPETPSNMHSYGHQQYQPSMTPHAAAYPANNNGHQTYQPRPAQQPGYANHGQLGAGPTAQQPQQYARPPAQAGVPTQQAQPRPVYPSQTLAQNSPAGVAGTSSAGPSRPLPATGVQNVYSSPYGSKPTPQMAQPGATPHSMARQLSQPSNGVSQPSSLPSGANSNATALVPNSTGTPQGAAPGASTAPVDPAIPADLIKLVDNFKKLIAEQLKDRSKTPLLLAMSAIFRALGLSSKTVVPDPEEQKLEAIILKVFETSRKDLSIHPDLSRRILSLKSSMVEVLSAKLGPIKAECLFMSAACRALGFVDRSITPDSPYYDKAEEVLKRPLDEAVAEHRAWRVAQGPGPQAPQGQPSQAAIQPPTQAQGRPAVPQGQTSQAPVQGPVQGPTQAQRAQVAPQGQASQAPMASMQTAVQAQGVHAAPQRPAPGPVQTHGPPVVSQPQPRASHAPIHGPAQAPVQAQRAQATPPGQASQISPAPAHAPAQVPTQPQQAQVTPQRQPSQAAVAPMLAPVQPSVQTQRPQVMTQGQASQSPYTAMNVSGQAPTQIQRLQATPQVQASQAASGLIQARQPLPAPQAQGTQAAPQPRVQAAAPLALGSVQPSAQKPVLAGSPVPAQPVTSQAPVATRAPVAAQAPVVLQGTVATQAPPSNTQTPIASRPPVQAAAAQVQGSSEPTTMPPTASSTETPRVTTPPTASVASTKAPATFAPATPMTVPAVASPANQGTPPAPVTTPVPATTLAPGATQPPAVTSPAAVTATQESQPKVQHHSLPPKPPPSTVLSPSPTPATASTATMASSSPGPHGLTSAAATTPTPSVPSPAVAPAPDKPAQATM